MTKENTIFCPQCGEEINVSDILYRQVETQLKKDFENQSAIREREFQTKFKELDLAKQKLADAQKQQDELVDKKIRDGLKSEKTKLEKSIRQQIDEEKSDAIHLLEESLKQKTEQVKELNKTKAEVERLKREKEELKDEILLEAQKELSEKIKQERQTMQQQFDEKTKLAEWQLEQEREEIRKKYQEENSLKIRELEKKLQVQTELAEAMKRKAEQGSQQLQGEAQELAIEEILRCAFPIDKIAEVPKGVNGADVIHTVRTKFGDDAGIILYESKRTKTFSNDWVSKLKSDAVLVNADVCIIVTEATPKEIKRIGQIDGVWICTFSDFQGLVMILRDCMIKIHAAYASQSNKGEKMQMLYDYLTGNEFRLQVEEIIHGFNELQRGYEKERQAMERIWKEREKQLARVLLNTNRFIGSVKGIAGSSLPEMKLLEEKQQALSEE
ncbi:MAG: DUF2130 domain-containing protein [Planctomycetaceae bacterium]|jgi:hypothetical protein|nr:DUF2130 domain-containing protein [Planctomycetaceae bacterium]